MVRDPHDLCRTTRTSYPVVWWTTKISSPQNCNDNMLKNLNNRCPWLLPFLWNKTRVCNREGHAFLSSRSIIIHVVVLQNPHDAREKNCLRFKSVVVIRTTKKIVGPPDPLSWWSCGSLLIKVCVKPLDKGWAFLGIWAVIRINTVDYNNFLG